MEIFFEFEFGVWGMEFNSKLGVYKQKWHFQAFLVFNPNPNVYNWHTWKNNTIARVM